MLNFYHWRKGGFVEEVRFPIWLGGAGGARIVSATDSPPVGAVRIELSHPNLAIATASSASVPIYLLVETWGLSEESPKGWGYGQSESLHSWGPPEIRSEGWGEISQILDGGWGRIPVRRGRDSLYRIDGPGVVTFAGSEERGAILTDGRKVRTYSLDSLGADPWAVNVIRTVANREGGRRGRVLADLFGVALCVPAEPWLTLGVYQDPAFEFPPECPHLEEEVWATGAEWREVLFTDGERRWLRADGATPGDPPEGLRSISEERATWRLPWDQG